MFPSEYSPEQPHHFLFGVSSGRVPCQITVEGVDELSQVGLIKVDNWGEQRILLSVLPNLKDGVMREDTYIRQQHQPLWQNTACFTGIAPKCFPIGHLTESPCADILIRFSKRYCRPNSTN